jgi:hypothetical protein
LRTVSMFQGRRRPGFQLRERMFMGTFELIIVIVVVLFLFGGLGGGGYYMSRRGR